MTGSVHQRQEIPARLFKYRSLEGQSLEYVRQALVDGLIWFSQPSQFNDPFDCVPVVAQDFTENEFRSFLDRNIRSNEPNLTSAARAAKIRDMIADTERNHESAAFKDGLRSSIDKVANEVGILSLSEKCDHVLMWSHYANSHQGCCLRFRTDRDNWFSAARRVHYSSTRPRIHPLRDQSLEMIENTLLTKADFWSYENEWRVLDHIVGPGVHEYDPGDIDGLIFGPRVGAETRRTVMSWLEHRSSPIEILNARYDPDHFRLSVS